MKKTILSSVFLIVLFVFPVVVIRAEPDETLKAKIEKINAVMAEAMLSGNTEKTLAFYAADVISLPNQSPMLIGIEAIKKSSEEMANSGMKVTSFETKTKELKTCGDLVIEIGTYKISLSMTGMEEPMIDYGKYLTVWEKQPDGSLKIKVETWNTDINPMEQMKM